MRKLALVFFVILLSIKGLPIYASASPADDKDKIKYSKSAKKNLKLADDLWNKGKFHEASDYYKLVLSEPDHAEDLYCLYRIAEIYRMESYYEDAKIYYYKVITAGGTSTDYPMIRFWLGEMLMAVEQYDEASFSFQKFTNSFKSDDKTYLNLAEKRIQSCDLAKKLMEKPLNVKIYNAGENINSAKSDFALIKKDKNTVYFSGAHYITGLDNVNVKGSGRGVYDSIPVPRIFLSDYFEGKWGERELINIRYNTDAILYWMGTPCLTSDGQYLFLTIVEQLPNGMVTALYKSKWDGKRWSSPKLLDEPINAKGYTSKHPSIFNDNGSEYLLYSSNQGGETGADYDLFMAPITNGEVGSPLHLGDVVNTTDGSEESPYYNPVNKILYFSSNGHLGMGGLDVFMAYGDIFSAKFDSVKNIGYPLSTGANDKFFIQTDSVVVGDTVKRIGYFSSNRPGGFAYKGGTCCDDIYEYEWTLPVIIKKDTIISVIKDDKGRPVAHIPVYFKVNMPDGTEKVIAMPKTDEKGEFIIEDLEIPAESDSMIEIYVSKRGYIPATIIWDARIPWSEFKPELVLERIELPIVFYEFDRYNLITIEKNKLKDVVRYLKAMPNTTLEIVSHTDSKGSNAYNLRLSEKRTNHVIEHLVKNGIDIARLKGKWEGEEKPLVSNKSKLGRDHNRRSQFGMVLDEELWAESGTSHIDFNMFDENGDVVASSESDDGSTPKNFDAEKEKVATETVQDKASDKSAEGLYFKVQIGAFSDPGLTRFEKLSVANDIKIEKMNKIIYRFVVGEFSTLEEAEVLRQKMIQEGISDAWVVPYQDGARTTMVQVKKLLKAK